MSRIALILIAATALVAVLAPAAFAGPRISRPERALIGALNDVRAQRGLPHLRASASLSRAADAHTRDMLARDFFDHPSSDGTSFDARIRRYSNASLLGETLAMTSRRERRRRGDRPDVDELAAAPGDHARPAVPQGRRRAPMGHARRRRLRGGDRGLRPLASPPMTGVISDRPARDGAESAQAAPERPGAAVRRGLAHPLVPTLAAAAMGVAYLIAAPETADMAAHTYRTWLWNQVGFATWNAQWYGGHHMAGYSLLYPPLAALVGTRLVGVVAAVVAVGLFAMLARRLAPDARQRGARVVAVPRRRDEQRRDRPDAVHARDRARRRRLGVRAQVADRGRRARPRQHLGEPGRRRLPVRRGARDRRRRAAARRTRSGRTGAPRSRSPGRRSSAGC